MSHFCDIRAKDYSLQQVMKLAVKKKSCHLKMQKISTSDSVPGLKLIIETNGLH